MPFSFRCTGCRAKLHVPTRWAGGTVPCPKCGTRVVVPSDPGVPSPPPAPATFESRSLEQSLATLESAAGGSFASDDFEVPPGAPPVVAETVVPGVTLPWWVIYAAGLGFAASAAAGFVLGLWWAASAVKS